MTVKNTIPYIASIVWNISCNFFIVNNVLDKNC